MNEIISIDLDILMSPYCGIYNGLCNGSQNRDKNWEDISRIYAGTFPTNQQYINIISNIINKYEKQVSNIFVGYDHSSIVNAIQETNKKYNAALKYDLYNIDYHHDVGYNKNTEQDIIHEQNCGCGNWVGFLANQNALNKYTWYCGIGSSDINEESVPKDSTIYPPNYNRIILNETNFPLNLPDIKILYITFSPPWIPPYNDNVITDILDSIPQDKIIYYDLPASRHYDTIKLFEENI